MNNNHALHVTIGAALASGFGKAFQKGNNSLTQMGSSIKKLEATSKKMAVFKKLKSDTAANMKAWKASQAEVKKLAAELKAVPNPTKKMTSEFERAKAKASRAKAAYQKKRDTLHRTRQEMQKAGVDMRKLSSEQNRLGSSIDKLRGKYQSLDKTLRKSEANKAKRAGMHSQMIGTAAAGFALAAPLKAAINFESNIADVKKKMNLPDDPMKAAKIVGDLEAKLKNMSRNIPISAAGLAEIAAAGASIVKQADELPKFIETAAKMATAFEVTPAAAGDAMANLSNVLGLPITEMDALGDTINHLSDNSSAKSEEIIMALQRVGGQGKLFGFTADQVTALSSSFLALGKQPQVAATATNAMLLKLQNATGQGKKFQDGLARMGLNAQGLSQAIRNDAQGALVDFMRTLSKIESHDRVGILADLFGLQYADDVATLSSSMEVYENMIDLIEGKGSAKKAGSMEREFESRSATTANALRLLGNSITEIGINLGASLLQPLQKVTVVMRVFTDILAGAAERFPLLSKLVLGTTFGLMALKIVSLATGYAWTFIRGGALMLQKVFIKLGGQALLTSLGFKTLNMTMLKTSLRFKALAIGGAIKSFSIMLMGIAGKTIPAVIMGFRALTAAIMTTPIGFILGGIAMAAGVIITNWGHVKSFFMTIWEPIKPVWEIFFGWVKKVISFVLTPLKTIGKLISFITGKKGNLDIGVEETKTSKVISDVASQGIAASKKSIDARTVNQNVKINVTAQPGQDARHIAEAVMKEFQTQSRGAMFDMAGATL